MRSAGLFFGVVGLLAFTGCSEPDPAPIYGNLSLANSTQSDNVNMIDLVKKTSCKRDVDNGVFVLELSNDAGTAMLRTRIKGFKSTPETYTCTQAADNKTLGTVGGKFDVCSVFASVPATGGASGWNGYSMFRDDAEKSIPNVFTYTGQCVIQILKIEADIQGAVTCAKMVQTYNAGALRNPIEADKTADVNATFKCPLE